MASWLAPPELERTVEPPTPARMNGVSAPPAIAPGAMLNRRWIRSALMRTLWPALLSEVGMSRASPSIANIGVSTRAARTPKVGELLGLAAEAMSGTPSSRSWANQ